MNASLYDAIIVGSGAGGSAAAYRLTQRGCKVLLLEKGRILPGDGTTLNLDQVIRQGLFKSKEPWLDRNGKVFMPEEYFNLGGKTKWYGAALLRFGVDEFKADEAHQCLAWPIAYEDLVPFYDEAERLLGVRQFEPEPDLQAIMAKLTCPGGGWQAQPLPLALAPEILDHPEEASHFDAFASVKGLKFDGQHLLDQVREAPNLEILTDQAVLSLLAAEGNPQRISSVLTRDGRIFQAKTVVLAAGALHSPRLLQDYLETTGLAKQLPGYRLVGRYYKHHLLTALLGFSSSRKTDVLRKTILLLGERFPHSSIQPLGFDGELIAALMPHFLPRWLARGMGGRAYGFFLQTEDGSHEANRVLSRALNKNYPQLDYDPARLRPAWLEHRRLLGAFRRILLKAGLMSVASPIPLSGTAHACGTLVTGNDPVTSVVDPEGRVHGMENLYVVDGSILPRSSRVNPSLSIYAWALRIADLLQRKELSDQRGRALVW